MCVFVEKAFRVHICLYFFVIVMRASAKRKKVCVSARKKKKARKMASGLDESAFDTTIAALMANIEACVRDELVPNAPNMARFEDACDNILENAKLSADVDVGNF
jgi:hypothetical protein